LIAARAEQGLAVSLSALQPAIAEDTPEREQIAALARQIESDRPPAEHAANLRRRNAPATTSTTPGCAPT
jgi:hypothetical protein